MGDGTGDNERVAKATHRRNGVSLPGRDAYRAHRYPVVLLCHRKLVQRLFCDLLWHSYDL